MHACMVAVHLWGSAETGCVQAGVRGRDPPRAWPTGVLKSVSCGMYQTQATIGAAIPSTFFGLVTGGGQFGTDERGKDILFAVSQ